MSGADGAAKPGGGGGDPLDSRPLQGPGRVKKAQKEAEKALKAAQGEQENLAKEPTS